MQFDEDKDGVVHTITQAEGDAFVPALFAHGQHPAMQVLQSSRIHCVQVEDSFRPRLSPSEQAMFHSLGGPGSSASPRSLCFGSLSSAFRAVVASVGLASGQHNTTKMANTWIGQNWIGQRQGPHRPGPRSPDRAKFRFFFPFPLLGLLVAEASQLMLADWCWPNLVSSWKPSWK